MNPFELKEVQIALLLNSDFGLLQEYYVRYPELKSLLSEPETLKALSERDKLPYEVPVFIKGVKTTERLISTFEDYVFYSKFKDPKERKKLCLSLIKLLLVAIKLGYNKLYLPLIKLARKRDEDYYDNNQDEIMDALAKYRSDKDIEKFPDFNTLTLGQSLAKKS